MNNNYKVNVLLSTYNGEKYIKEQLDSILNQTYGNIKIYVRDDGSKDKTVEILKQYEKKQLITFIEGENVGFIKSFFQLVKACDEADFVAYCDQDDVWFENKIEMAIEKLQEKDQSKPLLYFSDYDYYDSCMNFQEHCKSKKRLPSFRNSLVDCISLGFNSVYNKKALLLLKRNIPKYSCGHDWWTYMVCAAMGEVIYDKRYTTKYRRHEKNVSAGGLNFIQFQIWRIKKFFVNDYFKNVRKQLREFEHIYGSELSDDNKMVLKLFTQKKYNFFVALKKFLYPKPFRDGLFDEIAVRLICLIGKL